MREGGKDKMRSKIDLSDHPLAAKVPKQEFFTLYCVRHPQDKMLILVIAKDGSDAIQVCVEDGFEWAAGSATVTRIHKRMADDRGIVEVLETSGGCGNSIRKTRLFLAGTQVTGTDSI